MNMVEKLINYFKAGYPCLAILTTEEKRVQGDILSSAKQANKKVATWSAAEGIVNVDSAQAVSDTEDLLAALRSIQSSSKEDMVYVLRDAHQWPFDRDPIMSRYLREAITEAPSRGCCIVIIAPEFKPISSIEKLVTMIEYSLPDYADLREIAKNIQEGVSKKIKKANDDVIKALSGLSTTEAENALALSIIEKGEFSPEVIYREKVAAVKRSGLLEIVDPDPSGLDAIGGLENLKEWILKRKKAYSAEAEKYGLPSPKGVLLVGVPGSGKSLSAKAFGTALGIPTLKLDIGSLFNSLVGESEARTRDALQLAEAMSPVILWVDEVDKGLSGAQGSGSNDSGVTRRVFGTLLSWMQEKKKPVFLVMTANQVDFLPPEFLRRGRFDELFAIDLPHQGEREQISAVILKKLKRDPKKFDLPKIAQATDGYTGAEIEAVATESLFQAFDADREVTTDDIIAAAASIIPISKMMAEKIDAIRKWGEGRARPASISPVATAATTTRKIKV